MVPERTQEFIEQLIHSETYRTYEEAFSEITPLPVALRPVETDHLPYRGKKNENPFCALMAQRARSCSACLKALDELEEVTVDEPRTITCYANLCEMAVPIRFGESLIGYLQTGQFHVQGPSRQDLEQAMLKVTEMGLSVEGEQLRECYLRTPVLSQREYAAVVNLLKVFAEHLTLLCHQIWAEAKAEPPIVSKAKDYIREHYSERLPLQRVAAAVETSPYYFSKLFKRSVGMNFTKYVSHVRVKEAKRLLTQHSSSINEVAFQTGFRSLTHFNRMFKELTGHSPAAFRSEHGGQ